MKIFTAYNLILWRANGKRAKFQGDRLVVRKINSLVALMAELWAAIANKKSKEFPPKVWDFADVFLEELPGLLPPQVVEITIDLLKEPHPLKLPLYWMAPAEQIKLKNHLTELENLGFIHVSTSPWSSPVLFVMKKDGSVHLCIDWLLQAELRNH